MLFSHSKPYRYLGGLFFKLLVGVTSFFIMQKPCFAADLIEIYQLATQNDPIYHAAVSTRLATREVIPKSLAALLPAISGQAKSTAFRGNGMQAIPGGHTVTHSQGYTLTINQPLLNMNEWLAVKQANNTARQADATLGDAAQALIYRTAQAYFQVLLDQDNLLLIQTEKLNYAKQLEQTKQRADVGVTDLTTVYKAKAAYGQSIANEISAQNKLRNSQESLSKITGQTYVALKTFKQKLPLVSPQPAHVEQWVSTAVTYNLQLLASRYAVAAARDNIKVKSAAHLPTLDLVGNYRRANNHDINMNNQDGSEVSLALNIPIFSGGATVSDTHKAEYEFEKACAELENQYRKTQVTTRQKYNDVIADISKIKAERQAIKYAELSLRSTQANFSAGKATIVDWLFAQKELYNAKYEAANAQYQYLIDSLLLKQVAGTLAPQDLQEINQWLS